MLYGVPLTLFLLFPFIKKTTFFWIYKASVILTLKGVFLVIIDAVWLYFHLQRGDLKRKGAA